MSTPEAGPDLLPVVVGVSGHRTLRPQDVPALESAVADIFSEMRAAWPRTPFLVVSPCAEGADRLVARVALRHGARLLVLLPMPRALYEADFPAASLEEFRRLADDRRSKTMEIPLLAGTSPASVRAPDGEDRKLQYLRMGTFLARHCHVLIALWNGKPSAEVGGTAQIVAFKRTGRLELPPEMRSRMESDEEPFRYRRTPLDPAETGILHHVMTPAGDADIPDGSVGERRVLRTPGLDAGTDADAFDRRNAEIGVHIDAFNAALARSPEAGERIVPGQKPELPPDLAALLGFFRRTDALAVRLQRWTWRTLAALCVVAFLAAAAFGIFAHLSDEQAALRERALFAYLGFLGAAAAIFGWARHADLQDRFQDTRAVAEGLRVQFFWRLAGLPNAAADHYLRNQKSDLDWIRNAVRYFGLVTLPCDPPRLATVFDEWIESELRYYREGAEFHRRADARFRLASRACLTLGIALATGWGAVAAVSGLAHRPLPAVLERGAGFEALVIAVGLLAVAAGLLHLYNETRAHGAHARQYARMEAFFLAARTDLADPGPEGAGRTLFELGREALAENGEWVLLHRGRPLEVPRTA